MSAEEASSRAKTPWYRDGLRFSCHQCGNCCTFEGYVWVDRTETRRLAKHFDMTVAEFGRRYLRRVGRRYSLIDKPHRSADSEHACVFWGNGESDGESSGCSVYEVRPRQCRTFPFWREVVDTEESWRREANSCGGMNAGKLYAIGEVESFLKGKGETEPQSTPAGKQGPCCDNSSPT